MDVHTAFTCTWHTPAHSLGNLLEPPGSCFLPPPLRLPSPHLAAGAVKTTRAGLCTKQAGTELDTRQQPWEPVSGQLGRENGPADTSSARARAARPPLSLLPAPNLRAAHWPLDPGPETEHCRLSRFPKGLPCSPQAPSPMGREAKPSPPPLLCAHPCAYCIGGLLCACTCVCTQASVFVSHPPRSDKCYNKGNKHGAQGTWKEKLSLSEQSRKASWRRGHLRSCRMNRTWIVMEEKDSVCSGAVSGGG